ncbi:MAG TPA: UDP-N-acetylmuramoyl-tripeptide--D-alanyl-D-alanine ligase [Spirochaetota bacterium]|nr:UDP-N-acetylmuramoyl-tripeptide--D-alanyl-D-alanine ligase [Spirochaetota bacterium]HQP47970.1 UDP-N-acetylmuramoyl-tripeptide--D-alanyl-D-alanine ligase [Spirochaetota bacterium]
MKVDFLTTAGAVAAMSGGSLVKGRADTRFSTITTDSRELGPECLFIPIAGERFNGHEFIGGLARDRKIAGYLTHEVHASGDTDDDVAVIACDDTLRALGSIAAAHRNTADLRVIGITGTNGKTTTKELLWTILNARYRCLKNEKNYNNEIGLPFTLLRLDASHEMAVVEMGMNHHGEIDRLAAIARPDMAVITNVGEGHIEFLGGIEGVARAKSEIMNAMAAGSVVFINRDTDCFDFLHSRAMEKGLRVVNFGIHGGADVMPDSYELTRESVTVTVNGVKYAAPLYGLHNVYNILAAISVAFEIGMGGEDIREALLGFRGVGMRSEVIDRGYIIINDSYNSNPLSTQYSLESVKRVFPERRRIAVLSDMLELGEHSRECHERAGRMVVASGFDLLLAWGPMAKDIAVGAGKAGMDSGSIHYFENKNDLSAHLAHILTESDVVLVKGSRSMKMEEVVDAIVH